MRAQLEAIQESTKSQLEAIQESIAQMQHQQQQKQSPIPLEASEVAAAGDAPPESSEARPDFVHDRGRWKTKASRAAKVNLTTKMPAPQKAFMIGTQPLTSTETPESMLGSASIVPTCASLDIPIMHIPDNRAPGPLVLPSAAFHGGVRIPTEGSDASSSGSVISIHSLPPTELGFLGVVGDKEPKEKKEGGYGKWVMG